jgi:type II secretory ATPase GspE/PulE/Tfp pilus assembly ATPase PilB-like protein/tRNA A-37 threonylcarbamoyl transferase component Bud32
MPIRCHSCNATLVPEHTGPCPGCGAEDPSRTAVMAAPGPITVDPRANVPTPIGGSGQDPLLNERIAGCVLEMVIGQGGMGRVYRAIHEGLGKAVAVKVLNTALVANATFVERFLREARAAAQLDHPNVVRVLNAGEENGRHFIVMEMVEGENLRTRLRREGRLARGEALRIATSVAHALAAAHELGLVHRDIKPDNIMISEDGDVKVADFGLARQVAGGGDITGDGMACGTPPYMSPEQIAGHPVDGRSDLYSLGIVFYECLAGRRPFTAHDLLGWLECHTRLEPEPLRRHVNELQEEIAEVVMRLLAKRMEDRYVDAHELLADLQFLGGDDPAASSKESTRRGSRLDLQPTGIRRLHQLLGQGIDEGAVSLHLEPVAGGGGRVRMRVRTGLREIERLSQSGFRQLIDACKSAAGHANPDIDGPVEGVVEFDHDHQRRQAKLTMAPTVQGLRAALRLMGLVKPHPHLIQQGFSANHVRQWRDWMVDSPGVVAIAGPAGSGKGQTLGGLLGLLDLANMVTVAVSEETHVDAEEIAQLQVDHRTTRQDALRLALRQYPDLVLMLDVDGLGDRDTARDTFQAAASGRRVLASFMWEDAADSIAGLLMMGLDQRVLARTLRGIVSPRLVRLTCPACREPYKPAAADLKRLALTDDAGPYYRSRGCERCATSGGRRRTVAYECFSPTPEFWAELGEQRDEHTIAAIAARHGRVSMRDQLVPKVKKGYIDPAAAAAAVPISYY